MAKQFFVFIVVLRALSALIITNSHYNNIYPLEIIANGGLLGDVFFFAISGFCIANVSLNFGRWFQKRFIRIYCPVWIITLIYFGIGVYTANTLWEGIKLFLWPTYYHFVGSIILLYIPFYWICRKGLSQKKYFVVSGGLLFAQVIIYFTVYDTTYYHIDKVREPMIWFLFLQSMLLGAYFRVNANKIQKIKNGGAFLFISLILYFVSKMLFVKYSQYSEYQLLNQIILFGVLFLFFRVFMAFERRFSKMPRKLNWLARFLADHTLEIYLVQYVIIAKLDYGPFPVNWIVVSAAIIISAAILRYMSQFILNRMVKNA